MASEADKKESPPYVTYATFVTFVKGLRETGVPSQIDKSVLTKLSGSSQSALMPSLRWLGLTDAAGVPTPKLEELVAANDSEFGAVLKKVLIASYEFTRDGSIDLAKATGSQVEQKFRDYGVSGSTVTKAMAFFILAAKDAKIALGPHVKAPKIAATNGAKRKVKKAAPAGPVVEAQEEDEDDDGIPERMPGFVKIPVPLHGMPDGAVFLPDNMTAAQWSYALKITKFLIENYRLDEAAQGGGGQS